ncbi:hypothetical protein [Candidatus Thioglobus sp.]|uniref:hypothetical protein n=1 Tax=Candidatus Thioglobus sp. TaxID=2026721 RepID=UPI003D11E6FF
MEKAFQKYKKTINKTDELFFVVDTDDIKNTQIFISNIQSLKLYNFCLIIQHKNLEDELCFTCGKANNKKLFDDFYRLSKNKFKSKFAQDENLTYTLNTNNFNFSKLWVRSDEFLPFLSSNKIEAKINCKYRV